MELADALVLLLWEIRLGHQDADMQQIINHMSGLPISVAGQFMKRVAILAKRGRIIEKPGNIYQLIRQ